MTKFRYKIQKALFRFIGDIKWHGLFRPFWFTINSISFKLKGKHYRKVEQVIQPGDIIIRRFEGYVDKWLISGWWNHAGIYIGLLNNQKHQIIHAISDGVVVEDLIDFMRTDHVVVLRAPKDYREIAIERAKATIGSDYDFAFDFNDTLRFSCTELVSHCYADKERFSCARLYKITKGYRLINGKERFGRHTVVADDIVNTPALEVIWDSRKDG